MMNGKKTLPVGGRHVRGIGTGPWPVARRWRTSARAAAPRHGACHFHSPGAHLAPHSDATVLPTHHTGLARDRNGDKTIITDDRTATRDDDDDVEMLAGQLQTTANCCRCCCCWSWCELVTHVAGHQFLGRPIRTRPSAVHTSRQNVDFSTPCCMQSIS